jgi:hypothetical protein
MGWMRLRIQGGEWNGMSDASDARWMQEMRMIWQWWPSCLAASCSRTVALSSSCGADAYAVRR